MPVWIAESERFTWPINRTPHVAQGITKLLYRIEKKGLLRTPNYPYIEALLPGEVAIDTTAALALLIGLSGKDEDVRLATLDVIGSLVDSGRLHPDHFVEAAGPIKDGYWFKVNRFAPNLAAAGAASPLHAWTAIRILEIFVRIAGDLARDGHHLFNPLLELCTEHGLAPEPSTANALKALKGSGKSAKLAKQLLGLTEREGAMQGFMTLLAEARIKRAERWARVT